MSNYKANDQVLVTKDCERHRAGTILRVNNDRGEWLGCFKGGFGTLVLKANVRLATPADAGYEGTRDVWSDAKDQEILKLRRLTRVLGVFLLALAVMASIY